MSFIMPKKENDLANKTIVFIHGMYMTSRCWEHWITHFEAQGYTCIAPNWPGRDASVEELRANHPDAKLGQLTLSDVRQHFQKIIGELDEKPIVIGHSMGGLVVQLLLQDDLAAAGVAIDSAPPFGVVSTEWSFVKSNWPHITPFASQSQPVKMSFEHFQYAFTNGLPLEEQKAAFERYVVPESRRVPREALTARVDFERARGPLLLVAGRADHIIPAGLNRSNYAKYQANPGQTDFQEFAGRTHFILGQTGWQEVADYVLNWVGTNAVAAQQADVESVLS